MRKLTLSLVVHNHQPVGNFDFVFEEATRRAYDPILDLLERHPAVRISLHYTGPLYDWLSVHRPAHLERLRRLVARGQVELLTGAYYEPILVAIPDADKVGQIRRMTRFLRETFGCEPKGAWLAERVWEPHLPRSLAEAGVEYTLLDDTPFKMAGLTDDDLFGPYVTEEQGYRLTVFGNVMYLRYAVPWQPVESVMAWLWEQAGDHPGGVAVMGDDGEKFGLWPGTWEHCWGERGWMEAFFAALEGASEWLTTRPLGEVAAAMPPVGRIYLPSASYEEMMHWALPPHDFVALKRVREELIDRPDLLRFVKGGHWRSFLARYDEINQMHKKMLAVSRKVHQMRDGPKKDEALEHLWAAQCNCGYWHGLFGGIYLFHIRATNYAHLIAAEQIVDEAANPAPWARAERTDLDVDGHEELVINTDRQVLIFKPSYGGALVEWDWRQARYNLLNTMTRRREGYHQELVAAAEEGRLLLPGQKDRPGGVRVKEPDIHTRLFHDWYRRAALLDHFLHPDTTLELFSQVRYGEQGDFVDRPYRAQVEERADGLLLRLSRDGGVWVGERWVPVQLQKTIEAQAGSDRLTVHYRLTNLADTSIPVRFGVEWNWGIVGGDGEHCGLEVGEDAYRRLNETGEHFDVRRMVVASRTPHLTGRVSMSISPPTNLWHFPLEAISNSEAGYERVYQGTCTLAWWDLALRPGEPWELTLQVALG